MQHTGSQHRPINKAACLHLLTFFLSSCLLSPSREHSLQPLWPSWSESLRHSFHLLQSFSLFLAPLLLPMLVASWSKLTFDFSTKWFSFSFSFFDSMILLACMCLQMASPSLHVDCRNSNNNNNCRANDAMIFLFNLSTDCPLLLPPPTTEKHAYSPLLLSVCLTMALTLS